MSDDWAKKAFEKIQADAEEKRKNDEAERERQSRISAHARHLWGELTDEIVRKVQALNTQFRENVPQYRSNAQHFLEYKVSSGDVVEVIKDALPAAKLRLEYDYRLPTVKYVISKFPAVNGPPSTELGTYLVNLFGSEICFHHKDVGRPARTEEIAERLLNLMLGV